MDTQTVESIREKIAFEGARQRPPEGFPALPEIPVSRYTSAAFFQLEQQQLWGKAWLYAAHQHELAEPGSYKLWEDAGVPILILRDEQDQLRAFYNTCRHRGSPLVTASQGVTKRLQCPFHGWTYNLQGQLIGVPELRDFTDFTMPDYPLNEIRCERFGPWIFINRDREAQALSEFLGPVAASMAELDLDNLHYFEKHSIAIDANWKVALDSFMEVYHLPHLHPATVSQLLDHKTTAISLFAHGNSRMVSPNHAGYLPSPDAIPSIQTVGELGRSANISYSLSPNLVTPTDAGGFPFLLFWPLDIRRTRMDVFWFGAADGINDATTKPWLNPGQQLSAAWQEKIALFDQVLFEDTRFLPGQQRSMEAGAFQGIPLSYQERRIYHRDEAIDRIMGLDNIPPAMRVKPLLENYIEN